VGRDVKTNIAQIYAEGRLIRNNWSGTDADGRELLCLYTALAGSPTARPDSCPAELAPRWIAHLLPWLDDFGTLKAWPSVVRRVVALSPRLASVPAETEWKVRALCVREAMLHTSEPLTLAACELAAELCERRGRGESVTDSDLEAVMRAELWANGAMVCPTSYAASHAAIYAAGNATNNATNWAASNAASWAVSGNGSAARADRLADQILTAIEQSILVREHLP
jgi:hypothetical protein